MPLQRPRGGKVEHHGGLAKAVIHKVVSEAPTVEVDALRSAIQEVISVKEHHPKP